MQQLTIHILNAAFLMTILLGVPAITSRQFGQLQLTSTPEARLLTLGGLGAGAGLNLAGMLWLARGRKSRDLCRNWAIAYAILLLFEYLLYRKHIHFNWLKDSLLWIKEKLH